MGTKSQGYYGNKPVKKDEGTGGLHITEVHMRLPLRTPCNECPLRRDSKPGYLGGYTPEMYVEVLHSPASIACHSSPGFHEGDIARQRHCTGVAAFRANVEHVCQVRGYSTMAQAATEYVGKDTDRYFASDEEFVEHHKPGQIDG